MIEIKNVTKRFGQHLAVDNLNFTVNEGEILGFLGPNGAGKSTTMNIITGYISATEGTVTVDGYDILDNPEEVKKRIGYMPEFPPLYLDMTVREYLNFVFEIKKVDLKNRKQEMDRILELVRITDVRDRLIKNLSKGYKQRVGLAQALVGNPPVLILDEPTVGLDPKQIIEIRNLIKQLGRKHTIILSSHILPEVSAVCQRVVIINKGRIVASDTPENLSKRLGESSKLTLRIAAPERQAVKVLRDVAGIKYVEAQGVREPDTIDVWIEAEKDIDVRRPVFNALSRAGYPILQMKSMDLTLEDIFLQVTTQEKVEVS
ncbi:MAG: ABC transporter ATP-binding protein [Caldicoprobacterales bacterium]